MKRLFLTCVVTPAISGCGSPTLSFEWPDVSGFSTALAVIEGDGWASAEAVALPTTETLRLTSDPSQDQVSQVSMLLYDETLAELGMVEGPTGLPRRQAACELAEPDRVYRVQATKWEQAEAPTELSQTFLRAPGECVRLGCQFKVDWQESIPNPGLLTRAARLDDGRVLTVSSSRGLEVVDLNTHKLSPFPQRVEGIALDAVVVGSDVYVLLSDGRVEVGSETQPFTRLWLPATDGETRYNSQLGVDPDTSEVLALMNTFPRDPPEGTPFRFELRAGRSDPEILATWFSNRVSASRMDLVRRDRDSWVLAFGLPNLVEFDGDAVVSSIPTPPEEPRGDTPALYAVGFVPPATYFVSTQSGSVHRFEPEAGWITLRSTPAQSTNTPVNVLVPLGSGVFYIDEHGSAALLHRKYGPCWQGDLPGLDATSAVVMGDSLFVLGAGFTPEVGTMALLRFPKRPDFGH